MLALAHPVEQQIEAGNIPDYASAASAIGITRARISQVTSLLLLSPEIQRRIAVGEVAVSERDLRHIAAEPDWDAQLDIITETAETPSAK